MASIGSQRRSCKPLVAQRLQRFPQHAAKSPMPPLTAVKKTPRSSGSPHCQHLKSSSQSTSGPSLFASQSCSVATTLQELTELKWLLVGASQGFPCPAAWSVSLFFLAHIPRNPTGKHQIGRALNGRGEHALHHHADEVHCNVDPGLELAKKMIE